MSKSGKIQKKKKSGPEFSYHAGNIIKERQVALQLTMKVLLREYSTFKIGQVLAQCGAVQSNSEASSFYI